MHHGRCLFHAWIGTLSVKKKAAFPCLAIPDHVPVVVRFEVPFPLPMDNGVTLFSVAEPSTFLQWRPSPFPHTSGFPPSNVYVIGLSQGEDRRPPPPRFVNHIIPEANPGFSRDFTPPLCETVRLSLFYTCCFRLECLRAVPGWGGVFSQKFGSRLSPCPPPPPNKRGRGFCLTTRWGFFGGWQFRGQGGL